MEFVVEEAFKIKGDCCLIKLNNKSVNWCNKMPKKTKLTYVNKDELIGMLEYLLNNVYAKYRNKIFGILMGTDCALELANLFIFCF